MPDSNLAAALAAVQAELPSVAKGETARVETKGGQSYSYSYADLADISAAVLPIMAKHGLSFMCRPTQIDGRFVLAYSLMHSSGDREDGEYPLPTGGTPQAVGSAITYARRYVLCALTGVAPEDDDGQAAEREASRSGGQRAASRDETPNAKQRINASFRTLSAAKHESYKNLWERLTEIVGGNPSEVDWGKADQARLNALAEDAERLAAQVGDA